MFVVSLVTLRVLWKGDKGDFYEAMKGLHQGDPLSPYMFVMCMDKLSHLINDVVATNTWCYLRLVIRSPISPILCSMTISSFFGVATEHQMQLILDTLTKFCDSSGQKINMDKNSIMFSGNTPISIRSLLIAKFGFKETSSLGTYLEVPITGKNP